MQEGGSGCSLSVGDVMVLMLDKVAVSRGGESPLEPVVGSSGRYDASAMGVVVVAVATGVVVLVATGVVSLVTTGVVVLVAMGGVVLVVFDKPPFR
mmetsp:Transcript_33198/g.49175  ORF Transcript_33198/g.49175 Transcript_33198/m.49175 type:complete len:96 (+) Transcript_33198:169-456(+)